MYLINTFLGFLIAQLSQLLTLKKDKFKISYFFKDTWLKMIVSLALSFTISVAVHLNYKDALSVFNTEIEALNNLIYLLVGAVPEYILQLVRKRTGFLNNNKNG